MNNGMLLKSTNSIFSNQLNFTKFPENQPFTRYNKSEMLFFPEDKIHFLYFIQKGQVKVGTYDDEGNENVRAYLGKGDWLGEKVILGQEHHTDFAEVTEEDTIIYKVNIEPFLYALQSLPMLGSRVLEYLNKSTERLEDQLDILKIKDMRQRLWAFLQSLAKEKGRKTSTGIMVRHGLTQSEIADMIGTSRKTVSLTLNEFQDEGRLEIWRGRFRVL